MNAQDSIEQLLTQAAKLIAQGGSESPQLDAAVLLCHAIDKPRSYLFTWPERSITNAEFLTFHQSILRRELGEPIAYIIGFREFWSLPLQVAPSTLIPRPDTERLVEVALEKAQAIDGPILDLGTGTGAIALALASELPQRHVIGIDFQPEAVQLAKSNGNRLAITNCEFYLSNWFESLSPGTKFAAIVSNPPYIDENDPHLIQGDVRFEPKTALVADEQGMADIRLIAEQASHYLLDDGWLMFEHGFEQGTVVRQCLVQRGYVCVETVSDYAGLERVTIGKYKVK